MESIRSKHSHHSRSTSRSSKRKGSTRKRSQKSRRPRRSRLSRRSRRHRTMTDNSKKSRKRSVRFSNNTKTHDGLSPKLRYLETLVYMYLKYPDECKKRRFIREIIPDPYMRFLVFIKLLDVRNRILNAPPTCKTLLFPGHMQRPAVSFTHIREIIPLIDTLHRTIQQDTRNI